MVYVVTRLVNNKSKMASMWSMLSLVHISVAETIIRVNNLNISTIKCEISRSIVQNFMNICSYM